MDATVFEDFIDQPLRHCGRWPEPKSVLVTDNASFHQSKRIVQMCADAGVQLVYSNIRYQIYPCSLTNCFQTLT
jgi:hypothetical protein